MLKRITKFGALMLLVGGCGDTSMHPLVLATGEGWKLVSLSSASPEDPLPPFHSELYLVSDESGVANAPLPQGLREELAHEAATRRTMYFLDKTLLEEMALSQKLGSLTPYLQAHAQLAEGASSACEDVPDSLDTTFDFAWSLYHSRELMEGLGGVPEAEPTMHVKRFGLFGKCIPYGASFVSSARTWQQPGQEHSPAAPPVRDGDGRTFEATARHTLTNVTEIPCLDPTLRDVYIAGTVSILDDEAEGWPPFPEDVYETFHIWEKIPLELNGTRNWEKRFSWCVGAEVRAEMDIKLSLQDDLLLQTTVRTRLFEGTDCNTTDLEDSVQYYYLLSGTRYYNIRLDNHELYSDDYVQFAFEVENGPRTPYRTCLVDGR
jgi:hypothetical protein